MRNLGRLSLWLLPVILLSCSTLFNAGESRIEEVKEPPRLSVNHAAHLARDIACIDCHDPDETGEPEMPKAETCFDCHEDLEQENEKVQAYFAAAKQKDGSYRFDRPALWPDLIVKHKEHAGYEVSCEQCHGKPGAGAYPRPDPVAFMNTCMECHKEKKAPNECATCHTRTRKDKAPPDHKPKGFLASHGRKAPKDWRQGDGHSCAICHSVPESCTKCHATHRPDSHKTRAFMENHGKGEYGTHDGPFEDSSCALCHQEASCVRCHNERKPRNHTASFERRLHGLWANLDRQSCQTCHKQDTCQRCHSTTQPINHRGAWGSGQQTHCIACHDPLKGTGCYTCHKNTLGHLQATPKPADQNHIGAQDPTSCENCHQVLPHLNDGGTCGRCHK